MIRFLCRTGRNIEPPVTGTLRVGIFREGEYSSLHPDNSYVGSYVDGKNVTNFLEFSKVYQHVPRTIVKNAQGKPVWDWQAETHIDRGKLTPAYTAWRQTGLQSDWGIARPAGNATPVGYLTPAGDWLTAERFRLTYEIPLYYNSIRENPIWRNVKNLNQNNVPVTIVTRVPIEQEIPTREYIIQVARNNLGQPFPWPLVLAMDLLDIHPQEL